MASGKKTMYTYASDAPALERSVSEVERLHPGLVCPITAELFRDPVLCIGDGYTYERAAAEKWFADGKTTSPMTGAELSEAQRGLVPNFNARSRADQARGGPPRDGVLRVNELSVSVDASADASAPSEDEDALPRSGSFSALDDPPPPAEPAEPSAPTKTHLRSGGGGSVDAPALPGHGARVRVRSRRGKYLTDPGAKFVALVAADAPRRGSEWILKRIGERVAFKSAAGLTQQYNYAHFNDHGHGRVEMWTKGGDAGHFTLHAAASNNVNCPVRCSRP